MWYQHTKVAPIPLRQFNPELPYAVEQAILQLWQRIGMSGIAMSVRFGSSECCTYDEYSSAYAANYDASYTISYTDRTDAFSHNEKS